MIQLEDLKTGKIYNIPGSQNQVRLIGKFGLDSLCFMRVHDKGLHYGHEFMIQKHGITYIDLKEIE